MKYPALILVLLLFSCETNVKKNKTEKYRQDTVIYNPQVLITPINEVLNNYIKEYPIPKKKDNNDIYYYQIAFNNDVFSLMRLGFLAPDEIETNTKGMFYYNDSIPVSVSNLKTIEKSKYYDESYLDNELYKKIFSINQLQLSDETFPPIWKYMIKDNTLHLIEKDTIWERWN